MEQNQVITGTDGQAVEYTETDEEKRARRLETVNSTEQVFTVTPEQRKLLARARRRAT